MFSSAAVELLLLTDISRMKPLVNPPFHQILCVPTVRKLSKWLYRLELCCYLAFICHALSVIYIQTAYFAPWHRVLLVQPN